QAKHCDCGRDDCPYCTGAHWDQQYQSSEAGGLRRDNAQLRAQLADLTRQLAEAVKAEREACCAIVLEHTQDIGQTIVSKIRARTAQAEPTPEATGQQEGKQPHQMTK